MTGSDYSRMVDGAFKGLLLVAVVAVLIAMGAGVLIGKFSSRSTTGELEKARLELTVERMRSDELQRKLDLMTAKDLYYQHAMSNITMMLNRAVGKVEQ